MRRRDVSLADLYLVPPRNGIYKRKEFRGFGVKMVNMGELFANDFISNQDMERVELNNEEQAKYLVEDGDLLFGRRSLVEAGAGKCSILKDPLEPTTFESSLIRVRLDKTKVEPLFLFYFFASPEGRGKIRSIVTGTNVKGIRLTVLGTLSVPLPDPIAQRRIASILSVYDDLIENNVRRIKLLEQSARLLYEEWFARLRFPGHEHTRVVKGVPEGWEKVPLKELCELIDYGFTASASDEEVGPKLLRITDIVPAVIDWSSVPYCKIPDEKKERFRLREGDIVIARTGATVGYAKRLHRRYPEAVFASYLVRLRIRRDVENTLVGVFVESDYYKRFVKSQIGGAAQPNANAQVLTRATMLLPPTKIRKWFGDSVEPIFDLKELLQIENQKLQQARDILLPKLMSGEIDLKMERGTSG